ncbi:MAG TPA: DUF421 domain-containing protein [Bacillota bacterium]|nr:DUF421 domain-containing protein [Clostridiaceae bacterium]HNR05603.1 DUF421 domain-containing protein [Bacillota bacterium]HNT04365.1 DUF421 domain-containing protein [Bacillota bacterium]HPA54879.1 DUF421 domain-containing protein [Bacillota bacterium]HPX69297.1 DUF421 domain-containing protein [Bacillota bacterium]
MLIVFVRTLILYILIIVVLRLMGKRQVGQLQPSELVVALIIADLAAVPMSEVGIPLINGIIPIITLFIMEELLSYISMKSERARGLISGKPSILIERGTIIEDELRRIRYNINDLLEQLRLKNFSNVEDVSYAILETSGQLSVIPKEEKKPVTLKDMNLIAKTGHLPVTVIIDGRIISDNLYKIGLSNNWLADQLRKNSIKSSEDVFFAYLNPERKFIYQLRSNSQKK